LEIEQFVISCRTLYRTGLDRTIIDWPAARTNDPSGTLVQILIVEGSP
jgi:hypothetical protein